MHASTERIASTADPILHLQLFISLLLKRMNENEI